MKNIRWTLLALLVVAAPQIARAQAPADPGGATTTTTVTQGAPDSGTISNSTASDTTTTTTTSTEGISADASADVTPMDDTASSTDTLPNTGGEPIIMSVVGLAIAAAAFGVRRKVTA